MTPERAWEVGVSAFLLMLGIGSMYAMSTLQVELPRLLGLVVPWSVVPFGAACVGLAVGSGIAARVLGAVGPRVAGAAGTALWGLMTVGAAAAIAAGSFPGLVLAAGVGGAGVGVAYLTILATVSASFPHRPLIGSVIGPLGFTCGTALFMAVAAVGGFAELGPGDVGLVVGWTGALIVAIALAASRGLPPPRSNPPATPAKSDVGETRRTLAVLLFFNALPGMLVFGIAVQVLTSVAGSIQVAEAILAITTISLFLGGLAATSMRRAVGLRTSLTVLLVLRGVLLLTLPSVRNLAAAVVLIALVMFAHGAGFSLLPGMVRAMDEPSRFAQNYGRVLIAWGASGAVGAPIAALSVATTGGYALALALAGAIALAGAGWLVLGKRATTVVVAS